MSNSYICRVCGASFPEDELTLMDDELLCETCLDEETLVCADCGTRIWSEQNAGSSEHPLCQRCFDRNYTTCERCGAVLSFDSVFYLDDEDDMPYCESCCEMLRNRAIHDYSYRPEAIFYGDAPRYKHDGSLNDGFEIVSHPATLECHTKDFPWAQMMKQAIQLGYSSHKAETCGLHVHISRDAFGESVLEQEASIARLLFFVEKSWNELLKFSRRTNRQLERWAARYGYKDTPKEMMDQAKNHRLGRYTCVNLTNANTIEIRIFRGTLKYNTFLATLQLVNRLCDVAIHLSDAEIHAMSWSEFTSGITEPELIQYLKERRLYLNEPVESEAEV